MQPFDLLATFVEFEHQAIQKLLDSLQESDLELQFTEEETVRDRFIHMSQAEYMMAGYLYEISEYNYEKPNRDCSIQELKQAFNISKARHLLTLNHLTLEDLEKTWTSKKSGNQYSYKFLLWHFLEHLATHRGQIATKIRERHSK